MQSFTVKRGYRVPAQVTLLDWGGTTANFGCMAPASVFVETGNDLGLSLELERRQIFIQHQVNSLSSEN